MNSTVDDYKLIKSHSLENSPSNEYQDLSMANDLKGIMFEDTIKNSKKKIDYYKLSKQDLITLVKLSN